MTLLKNVLFEKYIYILALEIENKSVQLAQCGFPGLAIFNAKIYFK